MYRLNYCEIDLNAVRHNMDVMRRYIAPGAKIIGGGKIADNVVIGANAVVLGDVIEPGITVGGIPARKLSDHDSSAHLVRATAIYKR